MQVTALLLLLGSVGFSFGVHFNLSDCSHSSNKLLTISNVTLSTDPVHIPGDESITANLQVFHPIAGNNIKVDLTLKKKFSFSWMTIPCIQNMGSCSYDDVCHYLTRDQTQLLHGMTCPLTLVPPSSNPVSCTCPLQPGIYHLDVANFHIRALRGLGMFSAFIAGDYQIEASITDTGINEQVGCFHIDVSVATSK